MTAGTFQYSPANSDKGRLAGGDPLSDPGPEPFGAWARGLMVSLVWVNDGRRHRFSTATDPTARPSLDTSLSRTRAPWWI